MSSLRLVCARSNVLPSLLFGTTGLHQIIQPLSRCCYSTEARKKRTFIDSVRCYVKAGCGGMGGRSYGGVGGDGGSVLFRATKCNLQHPPLRFVAEAGGSSARERISKGRPGKDLVVPVPTGTFVLDDKGNQLADLDTPNATFVAAKGGRGGCEANGFQGQRGEKRHLRLELKTIADVGLVGFPNAGKSTLLSALSRAAPKIANYPFTTLRPEIGVVAYPDATKISIADLPGLVEGAHENRGMGHKFLRHIERTKALLFVVDVAGFHLSANDPMRSAFECFSLLLDELEHYQKGVLSKPAVLVVNKMDSPDSQVLFEQFMKDYNDSISSSQKEMIHAIHAVSAAHKDGTSAIKDSLHSLLAGMKVPV
eukprot:comp11742_c0_seq1/m.6333 comp11742_c0_seq1/g.6333  ORF comp11742_c0_seq1/g.6333 comp11742_c0_seq1/m.6333 type:complete len:367 (-) comp11742_c0_seq1:44-1144(-)